MISDKFGLLKYNSSDLVDLIYKDIDIDRVLVDAADPDVIKYLESKDALDIPNLKIYQEPMIDPKEFDKILSSNWLMPEEYKILDIEGFLVNQCPKQNYQRLIEELSEFRERNMIDLLRWLKYFVDTCRKNKIVWGVGRGSSVSSYVLYLIGVHKIDSVKYNLSWSEFLR